ncbi:MAG: NusG domain II-containing protein [Clostridia bacterium]|nr:NusG domain II-containing protein [Clostridia bacterium]
MKKIKIGDVIVILLLLLITAGVFCFRLFGFENGNTVVISVDGVSSSYPLDIDRTLVIENEGITLTVVIKDKKAYIDNSDCPEKNCVLSGKIGKKGEIVVCAPSKVYIKIAGEGENDYDFILG